ncbi:MAG: hypothetical protein EYC70_11985 [Planctomycetota bacterium]|nr:MAG: hypothetical protein EYC70_11985 [Planctomycetota bacterium]
MRDAVRLRHAAAAALLGACGGQNAGEAAMDPWSTLLSSAPALVALERGPAVVAGLPEGARVERVRAELPAGQPFELWIGRPAAAERSPCWLVAERAIHAPEDALRDLAPALESGWAAASGSFYAMPLPDAVRRFPEPEQELWRRERAVRRLQAARRWLAEQPWCARVDWLGASRGTGLVAPAATREIDTGFLILLVPVFWQPESIGKERSALAAEHDLRQVLPRLAGRRSIVVAALQDPNLSTEREAARLLGPSCTVVDVDAGHRFPLQAVWSRIEPVLRAP